jgi:hypothetical protein
MIYVKFHIKFIFYSEGVVSPMPSPQAEGPPFVDCLRMFNIFAAQGEGFLSTQHYYSSCY